MSAEQEGRRTSPSALRNRDPMLSVLRDILPPRGLALEIASGSGEHILHFAEHLPYLTWQPTDVDPIARASIAAWLSAEPRSNVLPPLDLDAASDAWPIASAEAIIAINMTHISPWAATLGLLNGASRLVPAGGPLVLYGPYRRSGETFAASNAAFDADLRARNPDWGIRALEDVEHVARLTGFMLDRVVPMPANNLTIIFRKSDQR